MKGNTNTNGRAFDSLKLRRGEGEGEKGRGRGAGWERILFSQSWHWPYHLRYLGLPVQSLTHYLRHLDQPVLTLTLSPQAPEPASPYTVPTLTLSPQAPEPASPDPITLGTWASQSWHWPYHLRHLSQPVHTMYLSPQAPGPACPYTVLTLTLSPQAPGPANPDTDPITSGTWTGSPDTDPITSGTWTGSPDTDPITSGTWTGSHVLFRTSNKRINVISRVRPAVNRPSCVEKLKRWTLHASFSINFFHTGHAYRKYWLLPLYITFSDLDLGRGSAGQRKAKPVGFIFLNTLKLNGMNFGNVL